MNWPRKASPRPIRANWKLSRATRQVSDLRPDASGEDGSVILNKIRDVAQTYFQAKVERAVVTVPAYTIALTWGAEPPDLDSHLLIPMTWDSAWDYYHVAYYNMGRLGQHPYAVLDVDDTSAYGPEIITGTRMYQGRFQYWVHEFEEDDTAALAASGLAVPEPTTALLGLAVGLPGAWLTGRIEKGEPLLIEAKATVLATGGNGQVFRTTSNAHINTGDGMGMALRAGIPVQDMEFFQFHPTPAMRARKAMRAGGNWKRKIILKIL